MEDIELINKCRINELPHDKCIMIDKRWIEWIEIDI